MKLHSLGTKQGLLNSVDLPDALRRLMSTFEYSTFFSMSAIQVRCAKGPENKNEEGIAASHKRESGTKSEITNTIIFLIQLISHSGEFKNRSLSLLRCLVGSSTCSPMRSDFLLSMYMGKICNSDIRSSDSLLQGNPDLRFSCFASKVRSKMHAILLGSDGRI